MCLDLEKRKAYALSKVAEFRSQNPCLDISALIPATNPPNLENVNLSKKRMAQLPFHPIVLSSLCGTIFGDTSIAINKNFRNARMQNRHSTNQTDWFMWKSLCIMQELISDTSILYQAPDGFQRKDVLPENEGEEYGKWKLTTKVSPKLTELYNILCPKGHKEIQRFWLNHMNNYFLMVLWLDDGGLVGHRQGTINCNNTPKPQAEILAAYLCSVWGIQCKAEDVSSKATDTLPNPVKISINDLDNLEKLLRIIAPIVPVKSMLYKVCLFPIESSRLQRWTSELKTLIRKDWHDDIDKIYADLERERSSQKKI